MKKEELKDNLHKGLYGLVDEWFDGSNLPDTLFNGMAKTVISSNINKFDGYMELITNENGDIMTDDLINNVVNQLPEKIEIDLKQYINLPFVPNKILILTKNDITQIIKGND